MPWMIVLGVVCGHSGFRPLKRSMEAKGAFFLSELSPPHGLPSHVSIRRLLSCPEKSRPAAAFNWWAQSQADLQTGGLVGIDGKPLQSTAVEFDNREQGFSAVVSFYARQSGLAVALADFRNGQAGEGEIARRMLASLKDRGVTSAPDAPHSPQKRRGPSLTAATITSFG